MLVAEVGTDSPESASETSGGTGQWPIAARWWRSALASRLSAPRICGRDGVWRQKADPMANLAETPPANPPATRLAADESASGERALAGAGCGWWLRGWLLGVGRWGRTGGQLVAEGFGVLFGGSLRCGQGGYSVVG